MEKLVDLHTHLETLQSWVSFRNKLQGHIYSIKGHIKKDVKCLLNTAIYVQVYQNYDDMILQIKTLKKEIATFGEDVRLITKKADLAGDYKVGIILHVESARSLTNPEHQLPHLYDLGVRGIIPIHFKDNFIGNSCDDPLRRLKIKKVDSGMTDAGYQFIEKMNTLGMWVDLAHTMDHTADQMLDLAQHVMVSHVGVRDIIPQMRNKSIAYLKKVAAKGGIFGITPWQHLIGREENSYKKVLQFILDHGLNHSVCIGTDFGAPIKSHSSIKSIFDLGKIFEEFKTDEHNLKWDNAYHFFERVLPD